MRIQLHVNQPLAIQSGFEMFGNRVVDVPISEFSDRERSLLAKTAWEFENFRMGQDERIAHAADCYLNRTVFYDGTGLPDIPVARADARSVHDILAGWITEIDRREAEKQAKREAEESHQRRIAHKKWLAQTVIEAQAAHDAFTI